MAKASSPSWQLDRWDVLIAAQAILHIFMAPYTKVEESFNVQAMHDILYHRRDLSSYDHFEFPGVVPRTFVGSLIVSLSASPIVLVISLLKLPKLFSLYAVRLVLGTFVLGTLLELRNQVRRQFGATTSICYAIITLTQFHLLFYCSRPLPNVFALSLVNLAFSCWLRGSPMSMLQFLVFTAAVFRCDTALLLAPVVVTLLWSKSISWWNAVKCCTATAMVAVGLSVAVDSIMWQRWTWPEIEIFWFNSVLNRSSEWGVSPPYWYFTSALPRAMLIGFPLALAGFVIERRTRKYILPVLSFVILYSKLPHKELRFILIGVPVLNIGAAATAARLYNNRKKPFWNIAYVGVVLMLVGSFGASLIMATASYANYPGGHALLLLHSKQNIMNNRTPVSVHVDVLPAMTGVSRFSEEWPPWSYSKEEGLPIDAFSARNYTYLLNSKRYSPGYDCLLAVPGFVRLRLQGAFPPIGLVQEPKVFIHGLKQLQFLDKTEVWPGCR